MTWRSRRTTTAPSGASITSPSPSTRAKRSSGRRTSSSSTACTSRPARSRIWFEDVLGLRVTEKIVLDSGEEAGVWVTSNNKTYDVAFTADHYGAVGRFHHVTFALDSREEILRAADIFLEHGVHIETGPISDLVRGRPRAARHREDRARQRRGSRRLGDLEQQDV